MFRSHLNNFLQLVAPPYHLGPGLKEVNSLCVLGEFYRLLGESCELYVTSMPCR